jgi:hypothetical protein
VVKKDFWAALSGSGVDSRHSRVRIGAHPDARIDLSRIQGGKACEIGPLRLPRLRPCLPLRHRRRTPRPCRSRRRASWGSPKAPPLAWKRPCSFVVRGAAIGGLGDGTALIPIRIGVGGAIIGGAGTAHGAGIVGGIAGGAAGNPSRHGSRVSAVTKCARASGSDSPRGAKAWRSRKKPVRAKASTRSPGPGDAVCWRRNSGSRMSLSR